MNNPPGKQDQLVNLYRKRAKRYDSSGIRGLEILREKAVKTLSLGQGDLVVDIGCGTGLNFALLQDAIGPEGRIVGVDLTDAMLDQARSRVAEHGWKNVELVQSDAAQYVFPTQVNGILSTFALTFIPETARVIENGYQALAAGSKWSVLDMAWPRGLPFGLRHGLFFLPAYGITTDVIQRRPWETVWQAMEQRLVNVERKQFWMSFFYLISGAKPRTV